MGTRLDEDLDFNSDPQQSFRINQTFVEEEEQLDSDFA